MYLTNPLLIEHHINKMKTAGEHDWEFTVHSDRWHDTSKSLSDADQSLLLVFINIIRKFNGISLVISSLVEISRTCNL